jgi:hypothetical protein
MAKGHKVDNEVLLAAALDLLRQNNKPLSRLPSKGRSLLFAMSSGQTVRARTSNTPDLVVTADRPTLDAKLGIEGTDWLLFVMAEKQGKQAAVYLIPTDVAVKGLLESHGKWLDLDPNTKGSNKTWVIPFHPDWFQGADDFSVVWSKYREGTVDLVDSPIRTGSTELGKMKAVVDAHRQWIAQSLGVQASNIKITIDLN